MKTNIATMSGSVVMTQCDNVVRGDRLVVDMTTGVSRVEGGRVQRTSGPVADGLRRGGHASPRRSDHPAKR